MAVAGAGGVECRAAASVWPGRVGGRRGARPVGTQRTRTAGEKGLILVVAEEQRGVMKLLIASPAKQEAKENVLRYIGEVTNQSIPVSALSKSLRK